MDRIYRIKRVTKDIEMDDSVFFHLVHPVIANFDPLYPAYPVHPV
jgi:hypothetical protein